MNMPELGGQESIKKTNTKPFWVMGIAIVIMLVIGLGASFWLRSLSLNDEKDNRQLRFGAFSETPLFRKAKVEETVQNEPVLTPDQPKQVGETPFLLNDNTEELAKLRAENQRLLDMLKTKEREEWLERQQAPSVVYDVTAEPALNETTEVALSDFDAVTNAGLVSPVEAGVIKATDKVIIQGTMITGTLETAIQSDLSGDIRANVAENVMSYDGTRILIPADSRLIGEYAGGLSNGQTRLGIIWTRVVTPEGVSVLVDSRGTDQIGRSGLTGVYESHFWRRFGASVMFSLIGGVSEAAADNNDSDVIVDLGDDFESTAEIALQKDIEIPPTVHIDQGEIVNVFVRHDLDFTKALNTFQTATR